MKRRTFITSLGIAATTATGIPSVTGSTHEADEPIDLGTEPYRTNEQLTADLRQLEAESDRIGLQEIARSAGQDYPIWEVTIGGGSTAVHLITQIHGDEPVGTEAALLELQRLATGDADAVERVLDELTLTVVPQVNPDGAMYHADTDGDGNRDERLSRRFNTQEFREGDARHEPYYYHDPDDGPPGYDLNRDFSVRTDFDATPGVDDEADWWSESTTDGETGWALDLPYEGHTLTKSGLRLGPETRAVTESFLEAEPDYAITHHHQGLATVPDSGSPPEPSVMSVMAAFGPEYAEQAPFYDSDDPTAEYVNPFLSTDASDRSLRLNTLVADALAETTGPEGAFDSITRYGYTTVWGSYLDTLCPQTDAAGMLYEIAGQSDEVGSRDYEVKLEATQVGFETTWSALADDPDLGDVDGGRYFDIPVRGDDLDETDSIQSNASADAAGGLHSAAIGTR